MYTVRLYLNSSFDGAYIVKVKHFVFDNYTGFLKLSCERETYYFALSDIKEVIIHECPIGESNCESCEHWYGEISECMYGEEVPKKK